MAYNQFDDPPIEIIQHIQSFLDGKEAARTIILSKQWFHAWSTRPVLYFDERDFRVPYGPVVSYEFFNFSRKTIQRYKDLNLTVDKFILWKLDDHDSSFNLAVDELIEDALRLGGNALELEINLIPTGHSATSTQVFRSYVDREFGKSNAKYVLPAQVFAASSLTQLYLSWVKISKLIEDGVLLSRLKSLSLESVWSNADIFRNIFLGCPLIEELTLKGCYGLYHVNVSRMLNLVKFHVDEMCRVDFKDVNIELATHPRTKVPKFSYLRCLYLRRVSVYDDFFKEFSSRFPCIEKLTLSLSDLRECKNIQISSHSLRNLRLYKNFMYNKRLEKLQVNVPNIARFVFIDKNSIPELSFHTASKEWESKVRMFHEGGIMGDIWFVKLKHFLTELRLSRISLKIESLMENMSRETIDLTSSGDVRDLLMGLIRICRPNFINEFESTEEYHFLYKLLLIENKNKEMYDLVEATVEFFDKNFKEWLPFAEQVNAPAFPRDNKQIRFRLNWAPPYFPVISSMFNF